MKMHRDTITGITGLVGSAFFLYFTRFIKQPAKLLEPGPRIVPYVALLLIAVSSLALLIKGVIERKREEKPYFLLYAVAMNYLGFLFTTPFATFAFIYDLKGESKVRLVTAIIISVVVTASLYAMFVYGFQIKLPSGILFE